MLSELRAPLLLPQAALCVFGNYRPSNLLKPD